jgi:hypothetical protein
MGLRRKRVRCRWAAALCGAALLLGATPGSAQGPVPAAPGEGGKASSPAWAPAETAPVRPGVRVTTESGHICTSNFVFYSARPKDRAQRFDVYIGIAAHCFTLDGSDDSNACIARTRPLGSKATVRGATKPAVLVYSSWITAKAAKETDPDVCAVNDFALLRLHPADHDKVNPSVLYFGGPTGTRTTGTSLGDVVHTYGNSNLRFGVDQISPKRGISIGTTNAGWSHRVHTATPGVPGDSGSAMLDASGRALGVLVTLDKEPYPAANGVTDLGRALAYANAKTRARYVLATGTEPFEDRVLP